VVSYLGDRFFDKKMLRRGFATSSKKMAGITLEKKKELWAAGTTISWQWVLQIELRLG
jgi:hypothetical protein